MTANSTCIATNTTDATTAMIATTATTLKTFCVIYVATFDMLLSLLTINQDPPKGHLMGITPIFIFFC